jgi:predicted RecA/RadA family phage recombinase
MVRSRSAVQFCPSAHVRVTASDVVLYGSVVRVGLQFCPSAHVRVTASDVVLYGSVVRVGLQFCPSAHIRITVHSNNATLAHLVERGYRKP